MKTRAAALALFFALSVLVSGRNVTIVNPTNKPVPIKVAGAPAAVPTPTASPGATATATATAASPSPTAVGIVQPTFVSEAHSATDGAGTSFNTSTLPVTVTGSNPFLVVIWHAEFGASLPVDRNGWTVTYNGVPGRLFVIGDGYTGSAGNTLFRAYCWTNPPAGAHNVVVSLKDNTGTISTNPQELAVSALLFNNVANTLFPIRDIQSDYAYTNRTAETVTVNSLTTDLVVHAIGNSLTTQGTLGAGETQRSIANDGTDDASILVSTKNGGASTTSVSSSGWANTFHLMGFAFSIMGFGTTEPLTVFTDNFTRANEDPLSNGGTWTTPIGAATVGKMVLVSNAAKGATAGENLAMVNTPAFTATQRARGKWTGSGTFPRFACVRMGGPSSANCYMTGISGAASLQLLKITDSGSSLGYSPVTVTWENGTSNTYLAGRSFIAGDMFELEASGTSTTVINVYWNQMKIGTYSDSSSPFTSGKPGIGVFGADSVLSEFEASAGSLPIRKIQ